MKSTVISAAADSHTTVVVLNPGEEAFAALTRFADADGHFRRVAHRDRSVRKRRRRLVGLCDQELQKIRVDEQCEVLSAIGDIATGDDGKASLHVHVVLGLSDGSTRGGHLLEGKVRPTLEAVIERTRAGLRRRKQPDLRHRADRSVREVLGTVVADGKHGEISVLQPEHVHPFRNRRSGTARRSRPGAKRRSRNSRR